MRSGWGIFSSEKSFSRLTSMTERSAMPACSSQNTRASVMMRATKGKRQVLSSQPLSDNRGQGVKQKTLAVLVTLMMAMGILLTGCRQEQAMTQGTVIGIIGAMDEEVAALKEAAKISKTTTIAEMDFCEGKLGENSVVIVQCGMGKVNAGICAHTLINDFGCTKIVNTGVAGSLDNQLDIGDIVVSVDAVQHDFDVEPIGFQRGEIPYTGLYAFPADEKMRAVAMEAAGKVAPDVHAYEGRVCSGDQFVSSAEQKQAITSHFGGMCCEMEGAAIAQVCYLNKIPFVVIRAISDKSDGSQSMEFEKFKAGAAANCTKIVEYMVGRL